MTLPRALPVSYYNSDDFFNHTARKLFLSTWQLAGHRSQLKKNGDFFTLSLFDQDLFVVLDNDTPKAFYNVCQHRGHKLIEQNVGNKKVFVCPYHAWCYALNGNLKTAPNTQNLEGFDADSIKLSEVRIENFCGFLYVNCDDTAEPMDSIFPDLKKYIKTVCPDIEDRHLAYQHSCDEACNWMLAVENYNECYHCKVAHPDFSKGVVDPASYNIKPFGDTPCLHHHAQAATADTSWYKNDGEHYNSFYLWPGSSIQIYPGGLINTYFWRPQSANHSIVYRGWYSQDGTVDDQLQKVIDLDLNTTFSEDIKLLNNVQRGLHSQGYVPGPLVYRVEQGIESEHSIVCLHNWLFQNDQKNNAYS